MTETYRAGADGHTKTTALLRALASLLEDVLLLQAGAPQRLRNIDKKADLQRLADTISFDWIESAVRGLDAVQSGMRRNLLRSLSLDALSVELESARK
jgi:DNA polymerase-3 subunit delta'